MKRYRQYPEDFILDCSFYGEHVHAMTGENNKDC